MRKIAVASMAMFLAACNVSGSGSGGQIKLAEAETARFHARLDAEKYHEIWQASSDVFHKAATEEQINRIYTAVSTKLGKVKTSKQVQWRENWGTGGHLVEIVMDTTFEKGTGVETLTFLEEDQRLKLAGYHINSTDMMLN